MCATWNGDCHYESNEMEGQVKLSTAVDYDKNRAKFLELEKAL